MFLEMFPDCISILEINFIVVIVTV